MQDFHDPDQILNLPTVDHSKFIDNSFMSDRIPIGEHVPKDISRQLKFRANSGEVGGFEHGEEEGDLKDILHSPVRYRDIGELSEGGAEAKNISIPQPVESHYPSITSNILPGQRKMLGLEHRGIGSHQNIGRVRLGDEALSVFEILSISRILYCILCILCI